jgi:GNAT superfamily N-acetyltransferase
MSQENTLGRLTPPSPQRIEQAALNGWPALQTLLYDGWVLRFAEGYTKRSNSVTPLYPSTLPMEDKVAFCEQLYRERGLPPLYRLTSWGAPPTLDSLLEARGYAPLDPTQVLLRRLSPCEPDAAVQGLAMEAWLAHYARLSGADPARQPSHARLLRQIATPRFHAALCDQTDESIAVGLTVVEGDLCGVFDLVVASAFRRRGYGRRLLQSMLAWACNQGARWAYIQVVESNIAARTLYAALGFQPCYHYWYRRAP